LVQQLVQEKFDPKVLSSADIQYPPGAPLMRLIVRELLCVAILATVTTAQNNNIHNPTWWAKYQYLSTNGAIPGGGQAGSLSVGTNVNASNECGPQSETFISLNPNHPKILVGASNEIFRLPQRGYFSSDSGASWGATDMPLPPPLSGTNDTDFASDPGVAIRVSRVCS